MKALAFYPNTRATTAPTLGLDGLSQAFRGPVYALGGARAAIVGYARRAGAAGIVRLGAVTLSDDPGGAANALLKAWQAAGSG